MSGLYDRLKESNSERVILIGNRTIAVSGLIKVSAYLAVILWSLVAWVALFRLARLWG